MDIYSGYKRLVSLLVLSFPLYQLVLLLSQGHKSCFSCSTEASAAWVLTIARIPPIAGSQKIMKLLHNIPILKSFLTESNLKNPLITSHARLPSLGIQHIFSPRNFRKKVECYIIKNSLWYFRFLPEIWCCSMSRLHKLAWPVYKPNQNIGNILLFLPTISLPSMWLAEVRRDSEFILLWEDFKSMRVLEVPSHSGYSCWPH